MARGPFGTTPAEDGRGMNRIPTGRLIVTYDCEKDCAGCCNRDWKGLPARVIDRYDYEEILITGGEPLLFPGKLAKLIGDLRGRTEAKIFVYTACLTGFREIAELADGMTLTLHDCEDGRRFHDFVLRNAFWMAGYRGSLRLNVFLPARGTPEFYPWSFRVKFQEWIKDCPLPANEELLRLPELWTAGRLSGGETGGEE